MPVPFAALRFVPAHIVPARVMSAVSTVVRVYR